MNMPDSSYASSNLLRFPTIVIGRNEPIPSKRYNEELSLLTKKKESKKGPHWAEIWRSQARSACSKPVIGLTTFCRLTSRTFVVLFHRLQPQALVRQNWSIADLQNELL
jgi:hypothetical protein